MRYVLGLLVLWGAVAVAQSTPHKLMFPGIYAGAGRTIATTDVLYCARMPAEASITATKIAAYSTGEHKTTIFGFALYEDDDAGARLLTGAVGAAQGAVKSGAQAPQTITAGTLYRVCVCAATGMVVSYLGIMQATACCQDYNISQLVNAFTPHWGVANEKCTTGVPPPTTGAITADASSPGRLAPFIPMVLVEE